VYLRADSIDQAIRDSGVVPRRARLCAPGRGPAPPSIECSTRMKVAKPKNLSHCLCETDDNDLNCEDAYKPIEPSRCTEEHRKLDVSRPANTLTG
jgi:hypothetical protein